MADLAVDGSVTRTELALADLDLQQSGVYEILPGTGPGAMVWRREVARSPMVHGEVLVGAVKDVEIAQLRIRVTGTTASQLWSRVGDLTAAFEQFQYDLSLVIGGVTFTWVCQCADWTSGDGGEFQKFHLMSHQTDVTFQIPRHPVPTAGSV
jgi:hypothetical protein